MQLHSRSPQCRVVESRHSAEGFKIDKGSERGSETKKELCDLLRSLTMKLGQMEGRIR